MTNADDIWLVLAASLSGVGVRDWSLVTREGGGVLNGGGGGGYKTERGASEGLPLQKGRGGRTCFIYAEGRGGEKKFWGSFSAKLEVLAILRGSAKSFHSLKGRGARFLFLPSL